MTFDPGETSRKLHRLIDHPGFKSDWLSTYARERQFATRAIDQASTAWLRERRDLTRALARYDTRLSRHVTGDRVLRAWTDQRRFRIPPLLSGETSRTFERYLHDAFQGLRELTERWREEFERTMPPNWRELDEREVLDVGRLMGRTGWSLAWSPPGEVVREVLAAEDDEARKAVLVANDEVIVADLERLLDEQITLDSLADVRDAAVDAVAAYRDEHYGPAQSHAATTVTTALEVHFNHGKLAASRRALDKVSIHTVDFRLLRSALVLTAVRQAIEGFNDQQLPANFNRACSAHRAQRPQFTRPNALTGIMLAVTFVGEIEQITRLHLGLADVAEGDLSQAA